MSVQQVPWLCTGLLQAAPTLDSAVTGMLPINYYTQEIPDYTVRMTSRKQRGRTGKNMYIQYAFDITIKAKAAQFQNLE